MNWRPAKETPEPHRQIVIRVAGSNVIWGTWVIKPGCGWSKTNKYEWVYTSEVMLALAGCVATAPILAKVKKKHDKPSAR